MRALLLHGYDARNRGDGALVRHSAAIIRDALGPGTRITLVALAPDTFTDMVDHVRPATPRSPLAAARYARALRNMEGFDAVFGVGGGYLRAGNPMEAAKTIAVHLPQLRAAARTNRPTIYLPQSVGPLTPTLARAFLRPLRHLDLVCARDDRTMALVGPSAQRFPDLTLLGPAPNLPGPLGEPAPVLCVRELRGTLPAAIDQLAREVAPFDAFVGSTTRGNDDRAVTARLAPQRTLPADDLLAPESVSRIVVAVRLHGALLALAAGHYVIHLAYERKGFGAFADLGLGDYVHNVFHFSPQLVAEQVHELTTAAGQEAYRNLVARGRLRLAGERDRLIRAIRQVAG